MHCRKYSGFCDGAVSVRGSELITAPYNTHYFGVSNKYIVYRILGVSLLLSDVTSAVI